MSALIFVYTGQWYALNRNISYTTCVLSEKIAPKAEKMC